MSKLATIRTSLQSNVNIQIVAVDEATHFPNTIGSWTHTVNFIVAPNQGLYTSKELQHFMEKLIPALQPTCVDSFSEGPISMMLGKLYFDEDLGTEIIRREITLSEFDFLPAGAVENGKTVHEETRKIRRRTWVRLYPDQEIATAHKRYEFNIPKTDLSSFKARGRRLGFIGCISKAIAG